MHLECQVPTQRYGRRPFGVGFLMAGFDVRVLNVTGSERASVLR